MGKRQTTTTKNQKISDKIRDGKNECTSKCKCLCDLCVIFGVHEGQGHEKPEGRN